MDGKKAFFEEKVNGYKDSKKSLSLSVEKQVLIKVELNDLSIQETFALRSTGKGAVDIEYIKLNVGDNWHEASITEGDIIGFNVDCSGLSKVNVIWA